MAYSSLIRCRADNRSTVGKESFYCLSNGEKSIKNISKYIDRYRDIKTAIENKENKALGIDMGAVRFCTFSNGRYEDTVKSLTVTELDKRIAVLQKKLKNKEKGSKRRLKNVKRISRLHQRKANIRNDHLHKLSTEISKNHVIVCVED